MARVKNQRTYTLRNCNGGTAMHLSGDDNYSITGFRPYDGSNQAWIFQQRDGDQNGWFIKSSRSGKYLGIEGNPQNGTLVVVVSDPFKWDVKDSNVNGVKGVRIMVNGKKFSLDLDYGRSANHTRIQLWESGGTLNQIWELTERASVKDQHTYRLKNCRGGTAVDLSGNDNYSIIGFTPHDGSNQAWTFQRDGDQNGWFIKSCRPEKYLGIEGNPQNGLAVVAVSNPFKWDIEDSDVTNVKGIRILVHGTNFSLDLSASNHTKIQLWGSDTVDSQIWELTEQVSIEDQHIYSLENRQRGPSEDQGTDPKILPVTTAVCEAFITGDLSRAEELLTQEIEADATNHISYANFSLIMARKLDWDRALQNAAKSLSIKPSLIGYITKGMAFCGKQNVHDAGAAFDFAFTFANGDSKTTLLLFLIKAIALFNANEHEAAMTRVKELAAGPSVDQVACLVVEAYLQVQLGAIAFDNKFYNEAVEIFTAAAKASKFFANLPIHTMYEEFTMLFGWDLKSLWQSANRHLCTVLLRTGKYAEGLELYLSMMEVSDEATKASTRAWFAAFK